MMDANSIAEACHEVNRIYCESLGDFSQPLWRDAPGWQKESAIAGVKRALEHPYMNAIDNHVNWMSRKCAEGWKYGPVKDAEQKLHPCMISWTSLPPEQREKDRLFLAVVRALHSRINEEFG